MLHSKSISTFEKSDFKSKALVFKLKSKIGELQMKIDKSHQHESQKLGELKVANNELMVENQSLVQECKRLREMLLSRKAKYSNDL